MRLYDFSFLKMLDYPFEPRKWFRYNYPLSNFFFKRRLKKVDDELKKLQPNQDWWTVLHDIMMVTLFTKEQEKEMKDLLTKLNIDFGQWSPHVV